MFVFILILIEFKVFSCSPVLSINNTSCVFSRRSWLSVTRAAWFTSGIWRLTTTSSWFRSPRSQSTLSTSTRMPVTWRQSTAWSVPENTVKGTGLSVRCKLTLNNWTRLSLLLGFTRGTVTCGTLPGESERRWLSWSPRPRSPHIIATPSAASSVQILRECPLLYTMGIPMLVSLSDTELFQ